MRVLVAGAGYVGAELARRLALDGHEVLALRRTHAAALAARSAELGGRLRGSRATSPTRARSARSRSKGSTRWPTSSRPTRARTRPIGAPTSTASRTCSSGCARTARCAALLFASSTSVYAQDDGRRVDETSPTEPREFAGGACSRARRSRAPRAVSGRAAPRRHLRPGPHVAARARAPGAARLPGGAALHESHPARRRRPAHLLALLPAAAPCPWAWIASPRRSRGARVARGAARGAPVSAARSYGRHAPRRGGKRCSTARLLAAGFRFRTPRFARATRRCSTSATHDGPHRGQTSLRRQARDRARHRVAARGRAIAAVPREDFLVPRAMLELADEAGYRSTPDADPLASTTTSPSRSTPRAC